MPRLGKTFIFAFRCITYLYLVSDTGNEAAIFNSGVQNGASSQTVLNHNFFYYIGANCGSYGVG
jgi:hypothetical protein